MKKSKTVPYKEISSTNYLTGKRTVVSTFASGKKKTLQCDFSSPELRLQKTSAMNQNGADEPKCTDREKEDVDAYNGLWKATSYGCEKDDLNNHGIRMNKELNEGLSTLYLKITNDQVLYEIKYLKTNEKFSTCLSNVTERWSVRNNQLTVSDTVQTIFKVGTFEECRGNQTVKKARTHNINLNQDTFKIVFTGEVPSHLIKICKASAMSIQFKKVNSYK